MIGLQIRRRHHNLGILDPQTLFGSDLLLWFDWTTEDSVALQPNLARNSDAILEQVPTYTLPHIQTVNGKRCISPTIVGSTLGRGMKIDLSAVSEQLTDTFSVVVLGDIFTDTTGNIGGVFYSFNNYLTGGVGFNCGYAANNWTVGVQRNATGAAYTVAAMNGISDGFSKTRAAFNVHGTGHTNRPGKSYVNASLGNSKTDSPDDIFRDVNEIYIYFRDDQFATNVGPHEMFEIFFVNGDITQHVNYQSMIDLYLKPKYPEVPWGIIPG